MKPILHCIRWLLVPVAAVATVVVCAFAARWAIAFADRRCAPENLIGGACVEPWHTTAVETATFTAMVLGALGFVLVPALLAPSFRREVAVAAFVLAVAVAVAAYALTSWPELRIPMVAIISSSAIALWWVWSRRTRYEA